VAEQVQESLGIIAVFLRDVEGDEAFAGRDAHGLVLGREAREALVDAPVMC